MFNLQIMKSAFKGNFWIWLPLTLMADIALISVFASDDIKYFPIFFSSIAIICILIYVILIPTRLVTKEVERGYLIHFFASSPLTRTQMIMSKMNFYLLLIFGTNFIFLITGYAIMPFVKLDIGYGAYTLLVIDCFLLAFSAGGIAFIIAVIFNRTIWSLQCTFYAVSAYGSFASFSSFSSFLTDEPLQESASASNFLLNILYNPNAILTESVDKWIPQLIALFVIGLSLYIGSVFIFKNKDLPL